MAMVRTPDVTQSYSAHLGRPPAHSAGHLPIMVLRARAMSKRKSGQPLAPARRSRKARPTTI